MSGVAVKTNMKSDEKSIESRTASSSSSRLACSCESSASSHAKSLMMRTPCAEGSDGGEEVAVAVAVAVAVEVVKGAVAAWMKEGVAGRGPAAARW